MRGWLVEQQQRGVPQERPGKGKLLPLPGRQLGGSFLERGVIAAGKRGDEYGRAGEPGGMLDGGLGGAGLAEGDVVGHRSREQPWMLWDPGDLVTP